MPTFTVLITNDGQELTKCIYPFLLQLKDTKVYLMITGCVSEIEFHPDDNHPFVQEARVNEYITLWEEVIYQ